MFYIFIFIQLTVDSNIIIKYLFEKRYQSIGIHKKMKT